jgi:hypothetical protein
MKNLIVWIPKVVPWLLLGSILCTLFILIGLPTEMIFLCSLILLSSAVLLFSEPDKTEEQKPIPQNPVLSGTSSRTFSPFASPDPSLNSSLCLETTPSHSHIDRINSFIQCASSQSTPLPKQKDNPSTYHYFQRLDDTHKQCFIEAFQKHLQSYNLSNTALEKTGEQLKKLLTNTLCLDDDFMKVFMPLLGGIHPLILLVYKTFIKSTTDLNEKQYPIKDTETECSRTMDFWLIFSLIVPPTPTDSPLQREILCITDPVNDLLDHFFYPSTNNTSESLMRRLEEHLTIHAQALLDNEVLTKDGSIQSVALIVNLALSYYRIKNPVNSPPCSPNIAFRKDLLRPIPMRATNQPPSCGL